MKFELDKQAVALCLDILMRYGCQFCERVSNFGSSSGLGFPTTPGGDLLPLPYGHLGSELQPQVWQLLVVCVVAAKYFDLAEGRVFKCFYLQLCICICD